MDQQGEIIVTEQGEVIVTEQGEIIVTEQGEIIVTAVNMLNLRGLWVILADMLSMDLSATTARIQRETCGCQIQDGFCEPGLDLLWSEPPR